MNLVAANDPILRKKMDVVENYDVAEMQKLIDDMYAFVEANGGAGVSASQLGIEKRVFVVAYGDYKHAFINPEITWESNESIMLEEGCLSYPGVFANVKRPVATNVTYTDYDNVTHKDARFTGITNRIILHEYDHMEGKLFYDHLSRLQMDRFASRVKKKLGISVTQY